MRRLLLAFGMSFFALCLFANSPVNFGVNFRVNVPSATFEVNDWKNTFPEFSTVGEFHDFASQSELGYAGGLFLRLNKNDMFLHSEAMFSINCTGLSGFDGVTNEELKFTMKSSSLNVPIYLGINFVNTSIVKVRAFTGPSLSWIMDVTTTGTRDGVELEEFNSDFDFDNLTCLWSVGAGVELFMFSLDCRYGFDMKGVELAREVENSFTQTTNMLEFTLGFKFM